MNYKSKTLVYENGRVEEKSAGGTLTAETEPVHMSVVNLYPEIEFQEILGFGGAFTESSGYVFSRMSEEKQREILELYFGESGLKYNLGRTHIDSCDFSLGNYSAVNDPNDREFSSFTLERDERYILPLLSKAQEKAGEPIRLLLSPWSPPAFMKTNGEKNHGGKLKPEYRALWAKYLCRYVKEYRAKGVCVTWLTVQNEPLATQTWDSCRYTSEEEADFIKTELYPELRRNGLTDVGILVWDHNKERAFERASDVMTKYGAEDCVAGVGVHWYTGDHFEALRLIRQKYPDKPIIFTEGCVECSKYSKDSALKKAQMYAHDMIGDFNAGLSAFLDWNLILDKNGGPNHVGNYCEAPLMCDTEADTFFTNPSFHYIGAFSRNVKRQAKAIAFSRFTDKLEIASFKNPDGAVVMIVLNRTDDNIGFTLRIDGRITELVSAAESLMSVLISEK